MFSITYKPLKLHKDYSKEQMTTAQKFTLMRKVLSQLGRGNTLAQGEQP